MSRAPEYGPILDAVALVALTDPAAAKIGVAQRIDRWTHAIFTGWGGAGIWIPIHMDHSETPDDIQVPVRIAPGVEYYHIRGLVSHRDKTTPATCVLNIASSTSGTDTDLTWQENGAGRSLSAAFEVATIGLRGESNGPLQVRSGVSWAWAQDIWTLTFDTGVGDVYGLCAIPIHEPR